MPRSSAVIPRSDASFFIQLRKRDHPAQMSALTQREKA